MRESECTARLSQPNGVEQWARKGTAWRFQYDVESGSTLVDHALTALRMCRPTVGRFWLDNVRSVSDDTVIGVLERVPELSAPCRMFAGEVLRINRERLLHAGRDI